MSSSRIVPCLRCCRIQSLFQHCKSKLNWTFCNKFLLPSYCCWASILIASEKLRNCRSKAEPEQRSSEKPLSFLFFFCGKIFEAEGIGVVSGQFPQFCRDKDKAWKHLIKSFILDMDVWQLVSHFIKKRQLRNKTTRGFFKTRQVVCALTRSPVTTSKGKWHPAMFMKWKPSTQYTRLKCIRIAFDFYTHILKFHKKKSFNIFFSHSEIRTMNETISTEYFHK